MDILFQLLHSKSEDLFYYSAFSFLKDTDYRQLTENTVILPLINGIKDKSMNVINIKIENQDHYFIEKYLKWDSDFFQIPSFKIELIICKHTDSVLLNQAINKYIDQIPENSYYYIDIPTENIYLLQALASTNFKLIETRLNYYLPTVRTQSETRYSVKNAGIDDIETLKTVATKMRNKYDRVHADSSFSDEIADKYLARFAEEAVKGFADIILVPNLPDIKPFGFLAANYPKKIEGSFVSKFVLAAIDSSIEKGWFYKLVSEMVNHRKQKQ